MREMLDRYIMVYLKPDRGSCGVGVMKVEKLAGPKADATYSYHTARRIRQFQRLEDLEAALENRIGEKHYLIQKRHPPAKIPETECGYSGDGAEES